MKKVSMLGLVFAVVSLLGCGSKTTNNNTTNSGTASNYLQPTTGTLQGKIMDAVTGAGIGGDLQVFLIQGITDRGPDKLITGTNDPLIGEYAFANIPLDFNLGEITYKIVAVKTGYQRFEANYTLTSTPTGTSIADTVINKIGNIYLFPDGLLAGDKKIYVYDPNGLPVSNADIVVQQNIVNNTALSPTGDRLNPTAGLYASISLTTNQNGVATVPGTNLVLGGAYTVYIAETTFNGEILAANTATYIESSSNVPTIIHLASETANGTLFATAASNQLPGTITASGVLTVTFNQSVVTSATMTCTARIAAGNGLFTVGTNTQSATAPVVGVLDSTGTMMTFAPLITAGTVTTPGSTLQYDTCQATLLLKTSQSQPSHSTLFTNNPATDIIDIYTGAIVDRRVQLLNY